MIIHQIADTASPLFRKLDGVARRQNIRDLAL